eukprot:scaffold194849_cov29-Tisochrysis_lutea.AAC.2
MKLVANNKHVTAIREDTENLGTSSGTPPPPQRNDPLFADLPPCRRDLRLIAPPSPPLGPRSQQRRMS